MRAEELMEVQVRNILIEHLKTEHGYVDKETDPTPEASQERGAFGVVRLDHPIWTFASLRDLHDDDHRDFEGGTPVEGREHHHEAEEAK